MDERCTKNGLDKLFMQLLLNFQAVSEIFLHHPLIVVYYPGMLQKKPTLPGYIVTTLCLIGDTICYSLGRSSPTLMRPYCLITYFPGYLSASAV